MEVTGAQTEVSLRGFNQRLSNKVLVLVNGRSVYIDLLGATLWRRFPSASRTSSGSRSCGARGPRSTAPTPSTASSTSSRRLPAKAAAAFNGGFGDHDQTHGSLWASGARGDFAWRARPATTTSRAGAAKSPASRVDLQLSDRPERLSRTTRVDARGTERSAKTSRSAWAAGSRRAASSFWASAPSTTST